MFTKRFSVLLVGALVVLMCSSNAAQGISDFGVRGLDFRGQKMKDACRMARQADIDWSRKTFRWNEIVDDQGIFDFTVKDKQIEKMLRRKINTMVTLESVHKVFAPDSGKVDRGVTIIWSSAPPAPEYLQNYIDFVTQTVERYDGDGIDDAAFITATRNVKHWQIENEPGRKPDYGSASWNGTPADYANMYMVAYDAIKQADPEAQVALSGFSYKAVEYFIDYDDSFILQVLRLLSEGDGDFDIFDYHFYEDYKEFKKIDKAIHAQLNRYVKFQQKEVWVTETNVNRKQMDPDFTEAEYNRFVAKDIVKRYATLFHNDVVKAFWHKLCDENDAIWNNPMDPDAYYKFRGLAKPDLTPKPVYYTYKVLIQKIKGKVSKVRKTKKTDPDLPDQYIHNYQFGKGQNSVYVMWYDDGLSGSGSFLMPIPFEQVLITHVITEPGVTEPQTQIDSTSGGLLDVTLNDSPIFVENYVVTP